MSETENKEACPGCEDCTCEEKKGNVVKLDDKREIDTTQPAGQVTADSAKGKEVIENLLKTLPPSEAEKLREALNSPNPPHIHIDENQNVFIGEAADKQVEMRKQVVEQKGPRPVTKMDIQRAKILEDRIKRWIGKHADQIKGKSPMQQREMAIHALHQEDLENMSPKERIKRLEQIVFGTYNKLGQDFRNLEGNQYELADAMDINLRAIAKMLNKLGIPVEEHNKMMEEAKAEIEAERKKMMEEAKARHEALQKAQMEAKKAAVEATEKQGMVAEAKAVAGEPGKTAEGSELPKDATVFGG